MVRRLWRALPYVLYVLGLCMLAALIGLRFGGR